VRLFVAVEPSARVRSAAAAAADGLRAALDARRMSGSFRWVPEENLHLTIWFLGEVPDARAPAIIEALRPPMTEPAFDLRISGLGVFPPSGRSRVVWMDVTSGAEALARIHDEVGVRLLPLGFRPEGRRYAAHLTLARIKEPFPASARSALRSALERPGVDAGTCRIDSLTVFRSRTAPKGAVYEPLLRVPLS
jgi:2'-5' RNA ligase